MVGDSIAPAADALVKLTGVEDFRFSHLMTMEAVDTWLLTLSEISENPVPHRYQKQRAQLQDAMLDTQS